MIDTSSEKPLRVSTAGESVGPYIRLRAEQLDEVRALLDNNHFRYWVDEFTVSLNGGPEVTVINFFRGTDPAAVQTILDSAA